MLTYNVAINACEKYEQCLQVNVTTYNAAIIAFAKGLQWQPLLCLLRELQQANVTTYNVAIYACEKDEH